MASDISLLETVHSRGLHFVVHLAPELRQEKYFYLKALWSSIPLPFYCHFHREVASPSEEARTLWPCPPAALGQYSAWFLFLGVWHSELNLIWVYHSSSLLSGIPSHPSPTPWTDLSLALPPYFCLPLKLGRVWLCSLEGTGSFLVGASACAWPCQLPAPDCSRCPLSPSLSSLYLTPPILHPSTFYNILLSSTVFSYLLIRKFVRDGWILTLPPFLRVRKLQKPQYNPDPKLTQNQSFCFLRLVTLERPQAYHQPPTYLSKNICVWLIVLTISIALLISVISSSQELFQIFFISKRTDISWIAFYFVVFLNSIAVFRECEILQFLLIGQLYFCGLLKSTHRASYCIYHLLFAFCIPNFFPQMYLPHLGVSDSFILTAV